MTDVEWWSYVDSCFSRAIHNYQQITEEVAGYKQPVFIDLIIKLTIARAYANKQTNRILTAAKILAVAEGLINKVKDEDCPLSIVSDALAIRESAFEVPIEILEQKLLLHRGLLMLSFNKPFDARQCFIDCLNVGPNYDVRIRKECVEQLQKLFREEGVQSSRLESLH